MTTMNLLPFASASVVALGLMAPSYAAYSIPVSYNVMSMQSVYLEGNQLTVQPASGLGKSTLGIDVSSLNGNVIFASSTVKTHGSFDPTAAWHVLNDGAFSRRIGWNSPGLFGNFYDDNLAVPRGESVWIQQTDMASKVKTYQVESGNGQDVYNPATNPTGIDTYVQIFGPGNSDNNTWRWNGEMDHNLQVVSSSDITTPNQVFTATYHLWIGDSITGVPNANYRVTDTTWMWSGPADLSWQSIPEPTGVSMLGGMGAIGLCLRRKPAGIRAADH